MAVVGNKWIPYTKLLQEGKTSKEALDALGLKRPCCRCVILCHVDSTTTANVYAKASQSSVPRIPTTYAQGTKRKWNPTLQPQSTANLK